MAFEGSSEETLAPDVSIHNEKTGNEQQLENSTLSNIPTIENAYDKKWEKRTTRKIDWRLLPLLAWLYTLCLVDRANISVARISGLDEDLDLDVGTRASTALLVFFVGYILLEIPSNIALKSIGVRHWITMVVICFGAFTIGQGFVDNWIVFAVLRAFLGAFEAGLYPGFVYLIASWYTRYQVQKRLASFFLTASALSSFGPIVAYGLIQISKHTPNYHGWRWIYIIEGAITVLSGVMAWFFIVDFPRSKRTRFLSEEERKWVLSRLEMDVGKESKEMVTWGEVWRTVNDWKIWCFSFIYMTGAIGSYSFTLFLPIILEDSLGFSQLLSFVLNTPPTLFSVICVWGCSYWSDRIRSRGIFVVVQGLLAIVGVTMIGFLGNPYARYAGSFIGITGLNGFIVTALAWQTNNIRGDAKRSIATCIIVGMSGVAGIYSSLVFRQQDAPRYVPGEIAVLVPSGLTIFVAIFTSWLLRRQNRLADEGKIILEGLEGFRWTV